MFPGFMVEGIPWPNELCKTDENHTVCKAVQHFGLAALAGLVLDFSSFYVTGVTNASQLAYGSWQSKPSVDSKVVLLSGCGVYPMFLNDTFTVNFGLSVVFGPASGSADRW